MKKVSKNDKLQLNVETIRVLDDRQLREVVGGSLIYSAGLSLNVLQPSSRVAGGTPTNNLITYTAALG